MQEGFALCRIFRKFGWEFFDSLNEAIYSQLVLEFYENALLEPNAINSRVRGKQLQVTTSLLQ